MKKAVSLALSLIMVIASLTALPVNALADDVIIVANEQELVAALNKDSVVSEINVTQSFTIGSDCTINFDSAHINYYSDTVVTVANGVTLTVGTNGVFGSMWPSFEGDWNTPPTPNGKVINNGTIIVANGGSIAADFDTNNGDVVVKNGGEAVVCNTNNGTVTVEDGGVYATTQGNKAVNNGTVTVYGGGTLESRFGCTVENAADGVINLYGTFRCGCINSGSDGFWFDNEGTVNGNGDIILYPATALDSMDSLIEKLMGELGQTSRFENWDDVNIYKQVDVSSYAELEAAMTAQRTVAGEQVEGNMDTIIVHSGNMTVPSGADVGSMAKVIVTDGSTITVENGASLSCGMENNGTVTVKSGGELATTMGGSIDNRNTLTVEDGAKLRSQMGGEVINENGATLTLDGDFYCGCFGMNGNDVAWFENKGTVSGSGGIILYQADDETAPVSDMNALIESVNQQLGGGTVPSTNAHTEHVWELSETITPATCAVAGGGEYICKECGVSKLDTIPVNNNHKSDKGTVTKKATLTATGVMTYRCTACDKVLKTEVIPKNNFNAKGKSVAVKTATVKKKNVTVKRSKAITVKNAKGKLGYKKAKGNKKITVAKNGNITVKKGLKKGTYKITIKVTAAGNALYSKATKTVTVKIVVK